MKKENKKKAKHGDVGTPERHKKNGGIIPCPKEDQDCVQGFSDWPSLMKERDIIDDEQETAFVQFLRDYQVGTLYKWKTVKSLLKSQGLDEKQAEIEREEARQNHNAVISFNRDLSLLANYGHTTIDEVEYGLVGLYLPMGSRLYSLLESLVKFYELNHRIKIKEIGCSE